mmetsp:Transcript_5757/g.12135  ORF Transcript_5757/g.12135 Transcript_5757/m.12135 type:complete len:221 (-) Transcript_5757:175-837(-)
MTFEHAAKRAFATCPHPWQVLELIISRLSPGSAFFRGLRRLRTFVTPVERSDAEEAPDDASDAERSLSVKKASGAFIGSRGLRRGSGEAQRLDSRDRNRSIEDMSGVDDAAPSLENRCMARGDIIPPCCCWRTIFRSGVRGLAGVRISRGVLDMAPSGSVCMRPRGELDLKDFASWSRRGWPGGTGPVGDVFCPISGRPRPREPERWALPPRVPTSPTPG